jgi:hypothetical protein
VVPNGKLVVQRSSPGKTAITLRGGEKTITTEGFTQDDSEGPVGIPLTYTATLTPDVRLIEQNRVLTPTFVGGVQSWTAGTGRTISTAGHVTGNPAGTGAGIPGRTIAEVGVAALTPSTTYQINGTVRFQTPDIWTWQDVKDFGTWQQLKTAKATWEAVRSSSAGTGPAGIYVTVYVSLSVGTTDYVAPTMVINIPMARINQDVQFSAYITTPASIPSNARLRLMHGTTTREYALTWDLNRFGVILKSQVDNIWSFLWFDGNTLVPADPQIYLTQEVGWEDVSHDAVIRWEGTPNNSISTFTGPSKISESIQVQLDPPDTGIPCDPVLISDPVSPALSQWFGLGPMEDLTRAARMNLLSVLNREDYVSISSKRALATGTFTFHTDTLEQRFMALSLFSSGRVLLLRNPDPAYPETDWYIACGDVVEVREIPDGRYSNRTWTVPFAQVKRPAGLIDAASGVTWQQIKDSGMTWAQLRAARETWLDVILEPVSA